MEPLYRGHIQHDPTGCLVYRGVSNSDVDLYTALCGCIGTGDNVLNWRGVLYGDASLTMFLSGNGISGFSCSFFSQIAYV